MFNILIFGCGKLGSRHLEGLVSGNLDYNIVVVDNLVSSLIKAKKKWEEIGGSKSNHKIFWYNELNFKIKDFDLAIIATSSKDRATNIKKLSRYLNIKYWLIEKVLAQSSEELQMIKLAISNQKTAFVNIPRREMKWHQELKSKFNVKKPLKVIKKGQLWGLACNAIHFIDLLYWWTGENLLSIETSKLDDTWFKSKRNGFFEITGELFSKFSNGSELLMISTNSKTENVLTVDVQGENTWNIFENNGIASSSNIENLPGKIEQQSQITGSIAAKIILNGSCELPNLDESIKYHKIFLNSMLIHWNEKNNDKRKTIPIT